MLQGVNQHSNFRLKRIIRNEKILILILILPLLIYLFLFYRITYIKVIIIDDSY